MVAAKSNSLKKEHTDSIDPTVVGGVGTDQARPSCCPALGTLVARPPQGQVMTSELESRRQHAAESARTAFDIEDAVAPLAAKVMVVA